MKKILYLVVADIFVPFYLHLGRQLESDGYAPYFICLLPREHLWMAKNGVRVIPKDVHGIKDQPITPGLFNRDELKEILGFMTMKLGGERNDWENRILRIASMLEELLNTNSFEAVVIWNGQDFVGKALSILARRKGIKTIFSENGYFPKTLQLDLKGVNVSSSITDMSFADICRSLNAGDDSHEFKSLDEKPNELKPIAPLVWADFVRGFISRKFNPRYYQEFPEHRGGSWFTSQWLKLSRKLIPLDQRIIPDKFIFVPFQVHDDTQILLNSNLFKTMEGFFEFSYAAIKRNFGDEYAIVVKEHPEDLCRYSYAKLKARYPDVIWLRKFNIEYLLDNAEYVFVVNSSVGLQALQRFKPTIVFGESFYTRDELVFRVENLGDIDGIISRAKKGMNPERRKNIELFLRFLKEHYFVSSGWKDLAAADISRVRSRILGLIGHSGAK